MKRIIKILFIIIKGFKFVIKLCGKIWVIATTGKEC